MTDPVVERIMFTTKDPLNKLGVTNVPALTTLLYAVCGNDSGKFNEATRLIELFITEALKKEYQHDNQQNS